MERFVVLASSTTLSPSKSNLIPCHQTITVGFVQPAPGNPTQQRKVKEVVKQWEAVANIKFRFASTGVEANNAMIRVSFQPNRGSWSFLGKGALTAVPKPQPTLNLAWVKSGEVTEPKERGVILHEFGHAIGYLHEHQSPRRGEKLTLNEKGGAASSLVISRTVILTLHAVIFAYAAATQVPPWDEEKTRHNIINVYNVEDVSSFSEVDFTSIMMCVLFSFTAGLPS